MLIVDGQYQYAILIDVDLRYKPPFVTNNDAINGVFETLYILRHQTPPNGNIPPGVVEYRVPPGVDEYRSGNCEASVSKTRLDGITWACEHACRAIGEADIFCIVEYIFCT